jgi:hypothetical protein
VGSREHLINKITFYWFVPLQSFDIPSNSADILLEMPILDFKLASLLIDQSQSFEHQMDTFFVFAVYEDHVVLVSGLVAFDIQLPLGLLESRAGLTVI